MTTSCSKDITCKQWCGWKLPCPRASINIKGEIISTMYLCDLLLGDETASADWKTPFASVQLRPRLGEMIPEYDCAESIETSVARETEGAQARSIHNNTVDRHAGQARESECLFSSSAPLSNYQRLAHYLSPNALIHKKYHPIPVKSPLRARHYSKYTSWLINSFHRPYKAGYSSNLHFVPEKVEAQRVRVNCPDLHSWEMASLGSKWAILLQTLCSSPLLFLQEQ